MDRTPKSKPFGFKKNGRSTKQSPSGSCSISKSEVVDLESLPIVENAIPTSPAVSRINTALVGQSSPQFVVGWNDGAGSDDLDMCSPIRAVPVLRNIRRCPDTFRGPKKRTKDNKEDILQCIDWSKNLYETTSREKEVIPDVENILPDADNKILPNEEVNENKVTESRSETTNNNIDILDDSADEMMIICSQAVEKSLSPSKPVNIPGKHPITPDEPSRKRPKMDIPSNARSRFIKEDPKADSASVNNIVKCDSASFKVPSQIKPTDKTSKVPNSSVPNQSLFEALLNDDEDDLFGSFDFHTIDKKIQHPQNKGVHSISSHGSISGPKLINNQNPATKPKYSKEQIEQRRQEAKKRLLFNKKYKSV